MGPPFFELTFVNLQKNQLLELPLKWAAFLYNFSNNNSKYDYSETIYKSNHSKIKIICKKHGCFYQIPKHHLNGSGCPKCSKIVSSPESEFLNYLKIPNICENRQKYLGYMLYLNGWLSRNRQQRLGILHYFYGFFEIDNNT